MTPATFNPSLTLTMAGGVTSHFRPRVENPVRLCPMQHTTLSSSRRLGLSSTSGLFLPFGGNHDQNLNIERYGPE
jgi:hypothetical protein